MSFNVEFGDAYGKGADLRLLELTPELVELIEKGGGDRNGDQRTPARKRRRGNESANADALTLYIKGGDKESAVLCTYDRTYELKLVESSNSLLLGSEALPDEIVRGDKTSASGDAAQHTFPIIGTVSAHYELVPTVPRLATMHKMLAERVYEGVEYERLETQRRERDGLPRDGGLYTLAQLVDAVQASEHEVLNGLREAHAMPIGEHYRLLGARLQANVLDQIVASAQQYEWSLEALDVEQCVEEIRDHEPDIVRHVLRTYAVADADEAEESAGHVRLDLQRLAVFRAEQLLGKQNEWVFEEFLHRWAESMPNDYAVSPKLLLGIAITFSRRGDAATRYVRYFPAADLSLNIETRMRQLFAARDQWTIDQIVPYLKDVMSSNDTVDRVLRRYARAAGTDAKGKRLYAKRT